MLVETRRALIKSAADAAILLDQQLTKLLDEYDFCIRRYEVKTESDVLRLEDVNETIRSLGVLPLHVANRIDDWSRDKQAELSFEGFEEFVLNEFSIHLYALSVFLQRAHVDLEFLDRESIAGAFITLRSVNKQL